MSAASSPRVWNAERDALLLKLITEPINQTEIARRISRLGRPITRDGVKGRLAVLMLQRDPETRQALRPKAGWTDERVDLLRRLWISGRTAEFISKQLRITRNAVIGKVHRLGLANLAERIEARPKAPSRTGPKSRAVLGEAFWTKDRIAFLTEKVKSGQSANQVARALGVSRNTALGKAYRLGLRFKGSTPAPKAATRPASPRMARATPQEPPRSADGSPVPGWLPDMNLEPLKGDPVLFCDLSSRSQCRWPVGKASDPGAYDMPVCGRFIEGESSYCAEHLARSRSGIPLKRIRSFDAYSIPTHMVRERAA